MKTKICIAECKLEKPLSEFYNHPQMEYGVDSKCKDCVKARAALRHHKLSRDADFIEKERVRHKEKYHRLGYKESQKEWDADKPWKNSVIYKGLRRRSYKDLPRNFELHHWNYNDEFMKDVFILGVREHKQLHNDLTIDLAKKVFFLKDGTYLDTKEKHQSYIEKMGFKIEKY